MRQYRTKEFIALRNEWYRKLKETGFEDIENEDDRLRHYHQNYFMHSPHDMDILLLRRRYYEHAENFYHLYHFKTQCDKKIWNLHMQGTSIRKIAKTLEIHKWFVERNLCRLKAQFFQMLRPTGT